MKLFKREEKIIENPTKFQEAWSNPRKKAAIKLGFWFLGMFILILFVKFASPNRIDNPNNQDIEITYQKMQDNLKENINYDFLYNITIGDDKYNYQGSVSDDIISGYKESNSGIVRYVIEDEISYSILNDTRELYEGLYEGIKKEILDYNHIYLLLYPKAYEEVKNGDLTIYKYNEFTLSDIDIYKVEVTTNKENIIKIDILINENHYELNYSNISKKE